MKSIISKTIEVTGRNPRVGLSRYMEINRRITVIRFLSIPIYRKEESFSD
jgi:hypothetical protein